MSRPSARPGAALVSVGRGSRGGGTRTSPGETFGAVQGFPDPVRFLLGLPTGVDVTYGSDPCGKSAERGGPDMIEYAADREAGGCAGRAWAGTGLQVAQHAGEA
ncbi:hypothetical protein GCM10017673_00450 [Streptosporangium violaceochromogenes]|nr:hypothetical protein GCM10017673_00450 [Streptosporangium violaceochromogenes]